MIPVLSSFTWQYKLAAAAILAAGLFSSGAYAGLRWSKADVLALQLATAQDDAARDAEAARQTRDALADYQTAVSKANARAVTIQAERDALSKALKSRKVAYESLPVSPDCTLSADRMQQLQGAFDAAYSDATPNTVITQPALPATR